MWKKIFLIILVIGLVILIIGLNFDNIQSLRLNALERRYKSKDVDTRGKAIRAVRTARWRETNRERALNLLLKATEDDNYWVRAEAITDLDKYDDPRVLELGRRLLKGEEFAISGTNIIGAMGNVSDMNNIIQLLGESSEKSIKGIKANCAGVLGQIGDERAIPPLINALDDEEFVAINALSSLRDITGKDFGPDKDRWTEWWAKENKSFKAVAYEINRLKTTFDTIDLTTAINRLWRLQAKEAIPILEQKLEQEQREYIKRDIIRSLNKLRENK